MGVRVYQIHFKSSNPKLFTLGKTECYCTYYDASMSGSRNLAYYDINRKNTVAQLWGWVGVGVAWCGMGHGGGGGYKGHPF